ncbi:MAG: sensor histidine kinase [Pirellulaceae bacterium]
MSEGSPTLQTQTPELVSTDQATVTAENSQRLQRDCCALLDLLLQSASLERGRISVALANELRSLCEQECGAAETNAISPVGEWLASISSGAHLTETQNRYEALSARLPEECVIELHSLRPKLVECLDASVFQRLENAAHLATRLRALECNQSEELENRKREALYHFAYGLSHELNNPLANISTRAGVLLQTTEDTGLPRDLLSAIVDNSLRGCEMLGDLMLVARPPKLTFAITSVGELLAKLTAMASKWAKRWSIEVEGNGAIECDSTFIIECDCVALREALWALVRNAIEASTPGDTVHISCNRVAEEQADMLHRPSERSSAANALPKTTSWICIEVQDQGPGLSQIALKHAFDPYFSGREAGRGLGLGLTKAMRIIEMHGGKIALKNAPTRGVRALAYLPLTNDNRGN